MNVKHACAFSGILRSKPLACLLLLMLFGCEATQSIEEIPPGLKDVGELKTPLEQVGALKTPLEQVAALDAPLHHVAELKEPLAGLGGGLTAMSQPSSYIPMFGFLGIVLFLAVWGGVKLGRR